MWETFADNYKIEATMSDLESPDTYSRPITHHGGAKYLCTIHSADGKGEPILVDVYCVIEAFGITCPAMQHALKKMLCTGNRGKGTIIEDIKGIFDAMWRALELQKQREGKEISYSGDISGIMRKVNEVTQEESK